MTLIVLFVVLLGAAVWQGVLVATNDPSPGSPTTPTIPGPHD